jgi:hypothetical protein
MVKQMDDTVRILRYRWYSFESIGINVPPWSDDTVLSETSDMMEVAGARTCQVARAGYLEIQLRLFEGDI